MPRGVASRTSPRTNLLLDRLGERYRRRFCALCEPVPMTFGEVLVEADERVRYVYFPVQGFISLIVPADGSSTLEVGLIGREGMLGSTLALEVATSPLLALVQGNGTALRMSAVRFRAELRENAELRTLMARYCYVVLRQCSQIAACTHYHALQARLARWLLMTQDRTVGSELQLTQMFLSRMLGVRRVGITQAATSLKVADLISYHRGALSVRDRPGLESVACSCYRTDLKTYHSVLG